MNPQTDLQLLLFTLGTAALATLGILPFGIAAGWWLSRSRGPGRAAPSAGR